MQTPTRMDKVAIEDYYHATTMKEKCELDETSTSIVIFFFSLNPTASFRTSTVISTFLLTSLYVHTEEK